jgi:gluconate 2-dehydrogenase gamma chain
MPDFVSRRSLLKGVGLASAAAAVPTDVLAQVLAQVLPAATLVTLSPEEGVALDAMVGRLIPSDANSPGALEAHAARYIDRALRDALGSFRDTYRAGLAAVDAYARASKGAVFSRLSPDDKDAVLTDMERNTATGFAGGSAAFFNLVLAHTIQGTFCDPLYGGNDRFVGWDLIGYPGIRLTASANDQKMTAPPQPTRMSAYDFTMFAKKKPEQGDGR